MVTYSKGQLTKSQDKLPALSGIAREIWLSLKERYIAGMWEGDRLHSLLWCVSPYRDSTNLPSEYRAPTWSWASIEAEIEYGYATRYSDSPIRNEETAVEVLHSKRLSVDSNGAWDQNHTTLLIEWSLRIRGPLRKGLAREPVSKYMLFIDDIDLEINSRKICVRLKPDILPVKRSSIEMVPITSNNYNADSPFVRSRQRSSINFDLDSIFLLPIRSDWEDYWSFGTEIYGLALYPTERRRGEFQRVGIFVIEDPSDQVAIFKHEDVLEEQYYEEIDTKGEYVITIV